MGAQGQWRDQSLFLRALAASVDTDAERALASQLAAQIARPDLGVMVGRQARTDGGSVYGRQVARGNLVLGGGSGIALDTERARSARDAILRGLRLKECEDDVAIVVLRAVDGP